MRDTTNDNNFITFYNNCYLELTNVYNFYLNKYSDIVQFSSYMLKCIKIIEEMLEYERQ